MIKEIRRYEEPGVETWEQIKRIMGKWFVPSYYHMDLHNKLQRLTQYSKSVNEYYKEMEVTKIRVSMEEDGETTMARFLHGLNRDISDIVELHHYVAIEDLFHQAIKVVISHIPLNGKLDVRSCQLGQIELVSSLLVVSYCQLGPIE